MKRSIAIGALVALALVGPATAAVLEPQVWGWEQFLGVDWTVVERRGGVVLEGYLSSSSPSGLTRIRLLIESLDATGGVLAQRVIWVPGDISPFSYAPFSTTVAARAPHYRVRVFTFDRIETHSWQ
jgi:hypothetical protein